MRLSNALNIDDLRTLARRQCPGFVFDYLDGAVEDEVGLAENDRALRKARLVPRYLVDVSNRDSSTVLFGRRYGQPFGIAPIGMANLVWPGTDTHLAKIAAAANIPYVLSTAGTTSIEDAAHAAGGNFWFQLYAPRDEQVRADLVRRADAAGAEVLVVTVDVPIASKRERDQRNRLQVPFRFEGRHAMAALARPGWACRMLRHGSPKFAVLAPYAEPTAGVRALAGYVASQIARVFTWEDFDRLREVWPRTLLIKGIMAAEDAAQARAHGADGIVLSNHGGRQLDPAPAPIDCIDTVRAATGTDFTIIADSGVRRGTDIAKLLAAGADFVFVGRAMMYGAAAGGAIGARQAFDILCDELDKCMAQLGAPDIGALKHVELRRSGA